MLTWEYISIITYVLHVPKQKYDAVVHINMVLHGNVIYPYISLHVIPLSLLDPSQKHIGILVLFLHYLVLLADSLYTVIF